MLMKSLLQLSRIKISLTVVAATYFGAILHTQQLLFPNLVPMLIGTFSLTAGCSILNQIQEIETDALMSRTQNRPLPSKTFPIHYASILAMIFFTLTLMMFALIQNIMILLLSLIILTTYNGIYTPLKRKTSLALMIGSFVGAFPPLLGWVATGGYPFHPTILFIITLFYLWQMPHFWLLSEKYQMDYHAAGIPIPVLYLPQKLSDLLSALWQLSYALCILIVAIVLPIQHLFVQYSVIAVALLQILFFPFFYKSKNRSFHLINVSILWVVLCLTFDAVY